MNLNLKRKFLTTLLCSAMVFSLTACGSVSSSDTEEKEAEPEMEEAEEEEDRSGEEAVVADTVTEEEADADGDGELSDAELRALAGSGMVTEIECDPIVLSMACSGIVEGTAKGDAVDAALEALSEWTGGSFVIEFYSGGELGGDSELIEGVQIGTIDIFIGSPSAQNEMIPATAVLDICGLYDDIDTVNSVLSDFKDELNTYYNEEGLQLMTVFALDFRILTSTEPIESAEDLQNLTIRTQENSCHMTFWSALGADPNPLVFGELYIALQQGTVDAQENPWATICSAQLYEVQEYITLTNHVPSMITYVANQSRYDSMSAEQQLALTQFIQYIQTYQMACTEQDNERLMEECIAYGCTVSEVPDDIRELYLDAAQIVIDDLKEELDEDFVQRYVDATGAFD